MARRSPARVRADRPLFDEHTSHLPGLSRRGRVALARLERDRFWPGAVATAYQAWQELSGHPPEPYGCGYIRCCPDILEAKAILHVGLAVLPPRDARHMRERLGEFPESW
ncbi:hypothetical protein [Herbidospora daliensis]|uniref:hypothetical protein n=1 Tax=Herbidospora daliensis TaxID=295585 RepID=UPI00078359C0|nr:hypothetical protein [Herbidospora daliensis]